MARPLVVAARWPNAPGLKGTDSAGRVAPRRYSICLVAGRGIRYMNWVSDFPRPTPLERLVRDVEWARSRGLGPRDLVPMLEKLVRHADASREEGRNARKRLAELLTSRSPWRAARLLREVLGHEADADSWGQLALAYSYLGHYQLAARAYVSALALEPSHPVCLHNYGHLLDVALNRPAAALRPLERAYAAWPEPEIGASLAHALVALGRLEEGRIRLRNACPTLTDEEREALLEAWQAKRATPEGQL